MIMVIDKRSESGMGYFNYMQKKNLEYELPYAEKEEHDLHHILDKILGLICYVIGKN